MTEDQWSWSRGPRRFGPLAKTALAEMAQAGTLLPTDLVWRDGMGGWIPAGRLPSLFPSAAAEVAAAPLPYMSPFPQPGPQQFDAATRMLLPVGRSGWAI